MGSFLDLDSSSSLGCLVPPQACALQTNYISLLKCDTKNIDSMDFQISQNSLNDWNLGTSHQISMAFGTQPWNRAGLVCMKQVETLVDYADELEWVLEL